MVKPVSEFLAEHGSPVGRKSRNCDLEPCLEV